ncbi:GIY-YIG nuclease family protein [Pelomonas sp. BJYL3]|uniref:GIY-YIG nuclease family protein n=1 Tax=Pelomonas sp. BJYL3 TaxID=2976697 RepID=UPI003FA7AF35
MRRFAHRGRSSGGYDQNVGKAGVIYILENDGLRSGWLKIGCSSRSGAIRATELNMDANTGTPAAFRCVFEVHTVDCGLAERVVFKELSGHRRGKWGQEFFEVDLSHARTVIRRVCSEIDGTRAPPPLTPQKPRQSAPSPRPQLAPPVFRQASPSLAAATPAPVPAPIPQSPIKLRWVFALLFFGIFVWVKLKPEAKRTAAPPPAIHPANPSPAPRPPKATQKRSTTLAPAHTAIDEAHAAPRGFADPVLASSPSGSIESGRDQAPTSAGEPAPTAGTSMPNYFEDSTSPNVKGERSKRRIEADSSSPSTGLTRADLTVDERVSLESICSSAKFNHGALAYQQCADRQLLELAQVSRKHDLSGMDMSERQSLSSACTTAQFNQGPAAYHLCIERQLQMLRDAPRAPDLSGLNHEERSSLDLACSSAKLTLGPAAYNQCRASQLAQMSSAPGPINLSRLNQAERVSIYSTCSQARLSLGPAALRKCLAKQMQLLSEAPAAIDLRRFPREMRTAIESACTQAMLMLGPAEYNRCIAKQVSQLEGTP